MDKELLVKTVKGGGETPAIAELDLSGKNYQGADLSGGIFHKVNFSNTDLSGTNLKESNFVDRELERMRLEDMGMMLVHTAAVEPDFDGAQYF